MNKRLTTMGVLFEKELKDLGLSNFTVEIFINNKSLNIIYDGKIIEKFSTSCNKLSDWLESHLDEDDKVSAIIKSLRLWKKIVLFVREVDVGDDYLEQIDTYVGWVTELYNYGSLSFLTSSEIGNLESFYMHVLRCYFPIIARDTYNKFKCGLGLWSMQGFERRMYHLNDYQCV